MDKFSMWLCSSKRKVMVTNREEIFEFPRNTQLGIERESCIEIKSLNI